MRVTKKGQITIPTHLRVLLGIRPKSEIEFIEENGQVYIRKVAKEKINKKFNSYRGVATIKMKTDEIIALTRGDY